MAITHSWSRKIPYRQLDALFKAVGWRGRGQSKWRTVLRRTNHAYSLWDGSKLVGFGRLFYDGAMCGYFDISVRPKYQGRGLGSQIMKALEKKVEGKGFAEVFLFPWEKNPGAVKFYQEHGFVKHSGMILKRHSNPE
jgi:GNAT superfamily N-acetyltransferase